MKIDNWTMNQVEYAVHACVTTSPPVNGNTSL